MFSNFFAICILLSIFKLCLGFLHFVKKDFTAFNQSESRNIFMFIISPQIPGTASPSDKSSRYNAPPAQTANCSSEYTRYFLTHKYKFMNP